MKSVRKQSMPRVFLAFLTLVAAQTFALTSSAQSKSVKQPQGKDLDELMFKDVPLGDPSYRAIALLRSENIIIGYPGGYFSGKRVLTRYEFAVALDRVRLPSVATRNPLQDESVALYYYLSDIFRLEISALGNKVKAIANKVMLPEERGRQVIKLGNDMPNWPQFRLELNPGQLDVRRENPFASRTVQRVCYFGSSGR